MTQSYATDNAPMELASTLVERTSCNVFLTGRAGTGKTTFLRRLASSTSKRIVVLASTGIAAVNAGGVTIHSFFQLPLSPFLPGHTATASGPRRYDRFSREKMRVIKTMDLLVIDEVSMVRADLLDAVDAVLRRHRNPSLPFGGVQLLLIGDLMQLAPVVKQPEWELLSEYYPTPYFFSSTALNQAGFRVVELTRCYRQTDRAFLDLLNSVRENRADASTLRTLNSRYIAGFNPPDSEGYIRLTTHNESARLINEQRLAALPGRAVKLDAKIEGEFAEYSYPADPCLELKPGARVMFLRNDPEHRYFNGTMGTVEAIRPDTVTVRTLGDNPALIALERAVWENNRYTVNAQTAEITTEVQGRFTQFPLRTAWAITVHKSQGLTFDRAIINVARSFAHGQAYVALSRCRSLEGLVLDAPLRPEAIISDPDVVGFASANEPIAPGDPCVSTMEREFAAHCFTSMFDMAPLRRSFDALRRVLDEFLSTTYPEICRQYGAADATLSDKIESVADRFVASYLPYFNGGESPAVVARISDAARYFARELEPFVHLLEVTPTKADNKVVSQRLAERRSELADALIMRHRIMETFADAPFSPAAYLDAKARASLQPVATPPKPVKASAVKTVSSDITDPDLFNALTSWRTAKANSERKPAYMIASTRTLIEISREHPTNLRSLGRIHGIGRAKIALYGAEILDIVRSHS